MCLRKVSIRRREERNNIMEDFHSTSALRRLFLVYHGRDIDGKA